MDQWLAQFLTVVYPTVIVCGTGLLGYWLKLRNDRRIALERNDEVQQLSQEVEALRQQLADTSSELHERIDFAERVIAQRRLEAPDEADTPTPV